MYAVTIRQAGGPEVLTWAEVPDPVPGPDEVLIDVAASADGVQTRCECEAQHADRICWHRAAVRMAIFGEIAARRPQPQPVTPRLTAADLSGAWVAAD